MLKTLIWKELLDHLLSLRFTLACLLCFFVLLISFMVRLTDYEQSVQDFHKEKAAEKVRYENLDHPWRITWGKFYLFETPSPLKIFVRGMNERHGGTIEATSFNPLEYRLADLTSKATPLFPAIDLVSFVGLILSLLAILFGYDAICGEKQNGTLRLILSNAVPRDVFLLAKWIGGYLALIMPFCFAILSMIALMLVQNSVNLTSDDWTRLLGIIGMSLLFLAVVYSLAVWVSALVSQPSTSIISLLTIWVVFFLAIPNAIPQLVTLFSKDMDMLAMQKDVINRSDENWREMFVEPKKAYDKKHGFGENWWETINWRKWEERKRSEIRNRQIWGVLARNAMRKNVDEYTKLNEKIRANVVEEARLTRLLGRLSPMSSYYVSSAEIAGIGATANHDFVRHAEDFFRGLVKYGQDENLALKDYRIENRGKRPPPWKDNRVEPLPKFNYVENQAGIDLKFLSVDIGVFLALIGVFFFMTYSLFLKYDVR